MSRQTVRCLAAVLALTFAFSSLPAFALSPGNLRQEHAPDGVFPSAWRFLESAWSWVLDLAPIHATSKADTQGAQPNGAVAGDPASAEPPAVAAGDVGASTDPNG